jgi:hypothetical protein
MNNALWRSWSGNAEHSHRGARTRDVGVDGFGRPNLTVGVPPQVLNSSQQDFMAGRQTP